VHSYIQTPERGGRASPRSARAAVGADTEGGELPSLSRRHLPRQPPAATAARRSWIRLACPTWRCSASCSRTGRREGVPRRGLRLAHLDRDYRSAQRGSSTRASPHSSPASRRGLPRCSKSTWGWKLAKGVRRRTGRAAAADRDARVRGGRHAALQPLRDALRDPPHAAGPPGLGGRGVVRLESLRWTGAADAGDGFLRVKGARRSRRARSRRCASCAPGAKRSRRSRTRPRSASSERRPPGVAKALPARPQSSRQVPQLPATLARRWPRAARERRRASRSRDRVAARRAHARRRKDAASTAASSASRQRATAWRREARPRSGVCAAAPPRGGRADHPDPKRSRGLSRVGKLRRWQIEVLGNACSRRSPRAHQGAYLRVHLLRVQYGSHTNLDVTSSHRRARDHLVASS